MTLETLRKALKDKTDGLAALEAKAVADGAPEADVKALEDAVAAIEADERKIKALEASEAARAKAAKPASAVVADEDELPEPQVKKDLKTDEKLGLIMMGMCKAMRDDGVATQKHTYKAIEDLGYGQFAKQFDLAKKKSLNSGAASQGGVLLPENMSSEIIPLLYPNTTFLSSSPRIIPMPNGTYKQPKGATGATAGYRGEARPMGVSHATLAEINMSAKLLAGVTTITEQLLRWSLPDAAAFAREDLSMAMGITLDSAAYFGSGTEYSPLGLTNISGVSSTAFTASVAATPTYTEFDREASEMEQVMINANLPMMRPCWIMSYRTFAYMANLRDGNGNLIYPTLQNASPTWRSKPVKWTTQFPNTLGGGGDESIIALIDFGHVMFGDALAMQMKITREASIVHNSTTINTWQEGVMGMAMEWEHDLGLRYLEAVVIKTGVKAGS